MLIIIICIHLNQIKEYYYNNIPSISYYITAYWVPVNQRHCWCFTYFIISIHITKCGRRADLKRGRGRDGGIVVCNV